MLDLFRMEVEAQAEILNNNLLALETNPRAATELEALMRASHSIKGAARIVQLDAAVRVAHVMEDCFVAAQNGTVTLDSSEYIDVLLQGVDMILRLSRVSDGEMETWIAAHHSEVDHLVTAISVILHPQQSPAPAPAPTVQASQPAPSSNPHHPTTPPPPIAQPVATRPTPPPPGVRDPAMLMLFRTELATRSTFLKQSLQEFKNYPDRPISVESLLQAIATMKGAARVVHFAEVIQLTGALEQCLLTAQKHNTPLHSHLDHLLAGVILLSNLAQIPETEMEIWLSVRRDKLEEIVNVIAAGLTDSTVPAAANSGQQTHSPEATVVAAKAAVVVEPAPVEPELVGAVATAAVATVEAPAVATAVLTSVAPPVLEMTTTNGGTKGVTKVEESAKPSPPAREIPVREVATKEAATKEARPQIAQPAKAADRVVRVSADNLNRIMGLAGESLVEANWLQPFADSLFKLRNRQIELYNLLGKLQDSMLEQSTNQRVQTNLGAARQKADECRQILADRLIELELFARRSANLSDRLYREVIASHMRPFADGVQGFPRMMRDLARRLNKQVRFEILGKATQVDRDILEKLEAPLTHILRNAVDHGVELPEDRFAAGKPAEGIVRLEAAHRAGMLLITISDDGRGVDLERLRQKVVNKGMTSPEMAAQLSETELMEFLFLPGFSTAKSVTEISGRGVGLDVVQSMVQEVGGIVRAVSQPGKGMNFYLQLPLTLSVIRTLLVEISGEAYAFPLTRIDRIVTIQLSDVLMIENRQYFVLDGQNIGLISAHQVLELSEPAVTAEELSIVMVSDRSNRYGLVVDRFLGERDLVVRPLDPRMGKVPDIGAAALMPDGSPVLIVDVEDIIRSIDKLLNSKLLGKVGQSVSDFLTRKRKRILIVDDSITVREVERKLLENRGYDVDVAVNGIDGWNAVRRGDYDLVISDIDMPRMNGFELVTQIKNHARLNTLPVIIVSYKDRESDRIRGLEVGADYYLTKSSFHDDTLIKAVMDLIGE
jgi:two-component system sensor histidine kinase and response regulator WspE